MHLQIARCLCSQKSLSRRCLMFGKTDGSSSTAPRTARSTPSLYEIAGSGHLAFVAILIAHPASGRYNHVAAARQSTLDIHVAASRANGTGGISYHSSCRPSRARRSQNSASAVTGTSLRRPVLIDFSCPELINRYRCARERPVEVATSSRLSSTRGGTVVGIALVRSILFSS